MNLNILERKGKKYFYFQMGQRRLYIGTDNKPKSDNVDKAISTMHEHIKKCEEIVGKLESFRYKGKKINTEKAQSPAYKLLVFSEGTLFRKPWHETHLAKSVISAWDVVFKRIGIYDVCDRLRERFERGEFPNYMLWTKALCEMLKLAGLKEEDFEEAINSYSFSFGAHELFGELKKLDIKTALIMSSFLQLAKRAKEELEINEIAANCELKFSPDGLLEDWEIKSADCEDKIKFVQKTARKYKIAMNEVVYLGNDVNDISVFENVGLAIAFNARKQKVVEKADIVVGSVDLRVIQDFLFIKRSKNII